MGESNGYTFARFNYKQQLYAAVILFIRNVKNMTRCFSSFDRHSIRAIKFWACHRKKKRVGPPFLECLLPSETAMLPACTYCVEEAFRKSRAFLFLHRLARLRDNNLANISKQFDQPYTPNS